MTELPDIIRLLLIMFNTLVGLYAASRFYELSSKTAPSMNGLKRDQRKKPSPSGVRRGLGRTDSPRQPRQTTPRDVIAPPKRHSPVSDINEPLTFTHLDALEDKDEPSSSKGTTQDDFTRILGIGPKSEQILKESGVESYEELSKLSPEKIKALLIKADTRYAMYDVTYWPRQAKLAAGGEWQKLTQLKTKLSPGRI